MVAYARHVFATENTKAGQNASRAAHIRQAERTMGKKIVDEPEIPIGFEYIWGWFLELHTQRTGTGFGANPITWEAIDAWSRLTASRPTPTDIQLLVAIDLTWREVQAQNMKKQNG